MKLKEIGFWLFLVVVAWSIFASPSGDKGKEKEVVKEVEKQGITHVEFVKRFNKNIMENPSLRKDFLVGNYKIEEGRITDTFRIVLGKNVQVIVGVQKETGIIKDVTFLVSGSKDFSENIKSISLAGEAAAAFDGVAIEEALKATMRITAESLKTNKEYGETVGNVRIEAFQINSVLGISVTPLKK